jgi:hypothetical protein
MDCHLVKRSVCTAPLYRRLSIGTRVPLFFALLMFVAGCGASDRGYVTGTVRLNGQPIGPGIINFQSTSGGSGAMATFAEDGKYTVTSSGKKEGAKIGEYTVTIHGESFGDEVVDPKAKTIIPAKYSNATTSTLTLKVEPGTKEVNFDLTP